MAVTVPAGLGDLTDEGGGECILGMRFAGFLSSLSLLVWHDPPLSPPFNGGCLGIIPNCRGLVKAPSDSELNPCNSAIYERS